MHTQIASINLYKTPVFIYMLTINSINFFLDMLHFKESCNFIGKNEFSWKTGFCQFLNIPII